MGTGHAALNEHEGGECWRWVSCTNKSSDIIYNETGNEIDTGGNAADRGNVEELEVSIPLTLLHGENLILVPRNEPLPQCLTLKSIIAFHSVICAAISSAIINQSDDLSCFIEFYIDFHSSIHFLVRCP